MLFLVVRIHESTTVVLETKELSDLQTLDFGLSDAQVRMEGWGRLGDRACLAIGKTGLN